MWFSVMETYCSGVVRVFLVFLIGVMMFFLGREGERTRSLVREIALG